MCQKCHDKCSKDEKFDKLVAKKLTVCKQANFKGDVTIDGQFCLKNPVTISVPDLHSGADLFKPTIQEAVDYFKGRHAMSGKIILKKNTKYVETNGVEINKLSSALSFNDNVSLPESLVIEGDDRAILGLSYLHQGIVMNGNQISNSFFGEPVPGAGDLNSSVTLVDGPNSVDVNASGVDLTITGLVPGDKIRIVDNSGTVHERSIVSVGVSSITYEGLDVLVGGYQSSITFLPNVEVISLGSSEAVFGISGCSVKLSGVYVNDLASHGSGSVRQGVVVRDGVLALYNTVIECPTSAQCLSAINSWVSGTKISPGFSINPSGYFFDIMTYSTMLSGSTLIDHFSHAYSGGWSSLASPVDSVLIQSQSNIVVYDYQISGTGRVGFNLENSNLSKVALASDIYLKGFERTIQHFGGAFQTNSSVNIDSSSDGTTPRTNSFALRLSDMKWGSDFLISNSEVGIRAVNGTTVSADINPAQFINVSQKIGTSNSTVDSTEVSVTTVGPVVLEPFYKYTILDAAGVTDLTLDLNLSIGGSAANKNKVFRVLNTAGLENSLELFNGVFTGLGVTTGNNKVTFDGASSEEFLELESLPSSNKVLVLSSRGVTFSTV